MVITYYGEGCFRLQSGEISLLVDPESNRLKADVVLRTELSLEVYKKNGGVFTADEISFPGEYEVKGIEITGVSSPSGEAKTIHTMYVVLWEDVRFAIVGRGIESFDAATLEHLNEPDVLICAVGEGGVPAEQAAKIVKQLEPSFVIPTSHKSPVDFLKVIGQKPEVQEKLVFKKKDLAEGASKVVLLEAKG